MSPTTKKILLVGGAAVAGFVIYKMVANKPAAPAAPAAPLATAKAATRDRDRPGVDVFGAEKQVRRDLKDLRDARQTKVGGVEEELGVSEDLGSLGGRWKW